MQWFATVLAVAALAPVYGQSATRKAAPKPVPAKTAVKAVPAKQVQAKQPAVKQVQSKAVASKQVPSKTVAAKVPARYTAVRRPTPRYYYQTQPTPERYKEIQQALAERGYFNGSPDGTWGASSTDALKRFQHDQNLAEEGKIDALSLTALGLGPRRTATASVTPQQAP